MPLWALRGLRAHQAKHANNGVPPPPLPRAAAWRGVQRGFGPYALR